MHGSLLSVTKISDTSKSQKWAFALCEIIDQNIELITDWFGVECTSISVLLGENNHSSTQPHTS